MKIQTKTTLLFTCITACIILLLSWFVYYFTSRQAATDFYKRLEIRAFIAARVRFEKDETSVEAYNDIRSRHLEILEDEREYFIKEDSVLSTNIEGLPQKFFKDAIEKGTANFKKGDTYYTGVLFEVKGGNYIIVLAAKNEQLTATIVKLGNILVVGFLVSVIIVYTISIFFSKNTYAPIRSVIKNVKEINAENLSQRLPVKKGQDEVYELTHTFNDMLDRLGTAFETQNNFVSNASHEFRTPITTIIGEADIALSRSRTNEELLQSVSIILTEAEKLKHITTSLLNFAQTGFDGKKQNWQKIRIDELVVDVKNDIEILVPGCKIAIKLDELPEDDADLVVEGNPNLLRLALGNVLQNACKYSDNAPVTVSIRTLAGNVYIITEDKGIGIPEDDVRKVFDPFFRSDNTLSYEGYGLGLPLALNIIRLHKGTIKVSSIINKGTIVGFILPIDKHEVF